MWSRRVRWSRKQVLKRMRVWTNWLWARPPLISAKRRDKDRGRSNMKRRLSKKKGITRIV
ncbi:zinc finger protein [Sesbania bispinosa]|nr:zinc finger protein [Sesbania bispinosa]